MSLVSTILGAHHPDEQQALIADDAVWTFAQIRGCVSAYATQLREQGVQSGDRVALLAGQTPAFWIAFLAIRSLGAVVVPLNLLLPKPTLMSIIAHAGCRLLALDGSVIAQFQANMSDQQRDALIAQLPPLCMISLEPAAENAPLLNNAQALNFSDIELDPNVLAVLIYTSGTTGVPKGVMLSEANLLANLDGIKASLQANPDIDRMLLALPLFHAFGLTIGLYCLSIGMPLILVSQWHPKAILVAMAAHQPTLLPLVPTLFGLLLKAAPVCPSSVLRACIAGGARLPISTLEQLERQWQVPLLQGYGLTEASPVVAVNRPGFNKAGTVGTPLKNISVAIVTSDGRMHCHSELAKTDQTTPTQTPDGEIWVKGPSIMLGYYQLPSHQIASGDVHLNEQGWLQTGDLGHLDADGYLTISGGRIKELIIRAGENIAPSVIEHALESDPELMGNIENLAIVGRPDERLGEAIVACVVLKAGQHEAEVKSALMAAARSALPAWMVPDEVVVLDSFPLGATGKVSKSALVSQLPTMAKVADKA
ncbi:MAG: class I adenylate-forming enzyme family protein [Vampirovibrionales bacterium]|nr:class I adenylate-forming enzyme family protein [Vampirovibrionales bacterium]